MMGNEGEKTNPSITPDRGLALAIHIAGKGGNSLPHILSTFPALINKKLEQCSRKKVKTDGTIENF